MLQSLNDVLESSSAQYAEDEILSFNEYLELVRTEPWITRNTFQLLHDMMLSSGVEHTIVPGKPIKHRYAFFEDERLVGPYVVFGQQKAKENLIREDRQCQPSVGKTNAPFPNSMAYRQVIKQPSTDASTRCWL